MGPDEICRLDATAQAELVRSGFVRAGDLVLAAAERIRRLNPRLNAVVSEWLDEATEGAADRGPTGALGGVPMLVKDLDIEVADRPFSCGMRILRDRKWRSREDSALIARFRSAGLVVLGKTNTPELGLAITTEPAAFGAARNPWDVERSPGGSSGGSAAAVAAGFVPVAHASDGGGSIRIPAAACGLYGLKPSRGLVSFGPQHGEYWAGFVANFVLCRSLRDLALFTDILSGAEPGDPYGVAGVPPDSMTIGGGSRRTRIALATDSHVRGFRLASSYRAAVESAGEHLEALGYPVTHCVPDGVADGAVIRGPFSTIMSAWTAHALDEWGERLGVRIAAADVEPGTWILSQGGRGVSATSYVGAIEAINRFSRSLGQWFRDEADVLITPILPGPPPRIGEIRSEDIETQLDLITWTAPFNASGNPAMAIPWTTDEAGMPIGLQLVAAGGGEAALFRVARELEVGRGAVVAPILAFDRDQFGDTRPRDH